jgi:hypothetical protein
MNGVVSSDGQTTVPTLAVGGVGGSGTRIIAHVLRGMDMCCGTFLNTALDTLAFTFLFRNRAVFDAGADLFDPHYTLLCKALAGGHTLGAADLDLLAAQRDRCANGRAKAQNFQHERMQAVAAEIARPRQSGPWFWKEPNTHVYLPQMLRRQPGLKYIHVVRNGLDMALSKNTKQFRFWGPHLFDLPSDPSASNLLRYWALANQRAADCLEQARADHLVVQFEAFCAQPRQGILAISEFLGRPVDAARLNALVSNGL